MTNHAHPTPHPTPVGPTPATDPYDTDISGMAMASMWSRLSAQDESLTGVPSTGLCAASTPTPTPPLPTPSRSGMGEECSVSMLSPEW